MSKTNNIQLLPHDQDAEEALLSTILVLPKNDPLVFSILTPDDFYNIKHQIIFKIMLELNKQNEEIDLVTVSTQLLKTNNKPLVPHLSFIADYAPLASNQIAYAKIVKQFSYLRKMILVCNKIINDCNTNNPEAIPDLLDNIEQSILNVRIDNQATKKETFSDLINHNIDFIELRQNSKGGLLGISSGYYLLDKYISGLQAGDLIILAARPGIGKTSLAINISREVANKKPALIFSLEMQKTQISMRLLAAEARINSNKLLSGKLTQSEWETIQYAAMTLSELPIVIDDNKSSSVLDIKAKARQYYKQMGNQLGLIIVDYLQLMTPSTMRKDRRDLEIGDISRNLKILASELNVPIIALSQLNRGLETRADKRPMLQDLRESGALEQDADIVCFIYRDDKYNDSPDNPAKNTAELIISKNRNGSTGTVLLQFIGEYTKFENI